MCIAPKVPKAPAPAQYQPTQPVQDGVKFDMKNKRRGFYAALFTGPSGITAPPSVTGTSGGMTGG